MCVLPLARPEFSLLYVVGLQIFLGDCNVHDKHFFSLSHEKCF